MDYTLNETYEYILDLVEKRGSELFQLPYVLNVFQTATYDFIRERIPTIEATQQVTQDLQKLMLTSKEAVTDNPDNVYTTICQVPETCHHLFRVLPIFKGNVTSRRPKLIRHGEREALTSDPHNRPTPSYALCIQYNDYVEIDAGFEEKSTGAYLTYLKHPDFATAIQTSKRIVDLPSGPIEDIVLKTVDKLLSGIGDPRSALAYQKEQTFGNTNQ